MVASQTRFGLGDGDKFIHRTHRAPELSTFQRCQQDSDRQPFVAALERYLLLAMSLVVSHFNFSNRTPFLRGSFFVLMASEIGLIFARSSIDLTSSWSM